MASFMKRDILVIAVNFFVLGIIVGAQGYFYWWNWIAILCLLFVTWQTWQRLSADLAAASHPLAHGEASEVGTDRDNDEAKTVVR